MTSGFAITDERDGALAAVARVLARRGYADSTVAEIASEAGWPVSRVADELGGLDECYTALFDWMFHRVHARAAAATADSEWPASVRDGLAAGLELLASQPVYLHAMWAGVRALGAAGSLKMTTAIEAFTSFLTPGFERVATGAIPPPTAELVGMQVSFVLIQHVEQDRVAELPAALPKLVNIALLPFCNAADIEALLVGG